MPECSVITKSWGELSLDELYDFLKLRTDVFLVEQRVDEEELDHRDREPATDHLWIADAAGTAAYLRVLVDATPTHLDATHLFGRVVVRADRRGEGLAQILVGEVMRRYGEHSMVLHAQEYIAPLYAKFGFESFGPAYLEAGISHISMYRTGTAVGTPIQATPRESRGLTEPRP